MNESIQHAYQHQTETTQFINSHPRCLITSDPGTGKTRAVLDAIDPSSGATLVLAPLSILEASWGEDIIKFNQLLKKENKIFKIETKNAVKNFNKMIKYGKNFLIDRGDLSKEISIENIPIAQRQLFQIKNKHANKNIFVATNLLESMIQNNLPTRGEANDIFNSLEMGADGLVLAAETAIGKNPIDCVLFLKKILKTFKFSKFRFYNRK